MRLLPEPTSKRKSSSRKDVKDKMVVGSYLLRHLSQYDSPPCFNRGDPVVSPLVNIENDFMT